MSKECLHLCYIRYDEGSYEDICSLKKCSIDSYNCNKKQCKEYKIKKFKDMEDLEKSNLVKEKFSKKFNLQQDKIEFADYCGQVNIFVNRKMQGLVSFRTTRKNFDEQIKDTINYIKGVVNG